MSFVRRSATLGFAALVLVALGGCNRASVTCSASGATDVITDLVKQSVEKAVAEKIHGADSGATIPRSKIRAAIAQLGIFIEDIRTSKQDPNSTKKFCEGSLKLRFPVEVINQADEARSDAQLGSVAQLADSSDVDQEANSFKADFEYDVQPTDEGDKVYGEIQTGTPVLNFASEVLASSLLRASIREGAIAAQQAQQAAAAEQNAALNEQKAADLNSAKTDNQLASQSILAVWRALSSGVRAQLLPQQRAWARKKDADCRVEAASASTDPTNIEVARLNCDTRITRDRMNELQQYRSQEPQAPSESGDSDQDL
jgi:uncharacterized protein YecT (DUF1311 family)